MINFTNKTKNLTVLIITFILLIAPAIFLNTSVYIKSISASFYKDGENQQEQIPKQSGFWTPPYIHIQDDNWTDNILEWIQLGEGDEDDPHIIENVTIEGDNFKSCIYIENCSKYFIIRNCSLSKSQFYASNPCAGITLNDTQNGEIYNNTIWDNYFGIRLTADSNSNTIYDNMIHHSSSDGISLSNAEFNTITNNHINDNYYGIYLFNSKNNNIEDNDIYTSTDTGISLNYNCNLNTVRDNFIYDSIFEGISLYNYCEFNVIDNNDVLNSSKGIYIKYYSHNNTITNNYAKNCSSGIRLWIDSDDNTVSSNYLQNCTFGVYINIDCDNNTIYDNDFINSSDHHGHDDGENNVWYKDYWGNFWDDYHDVDANDDGIGDSSYGIYGDAKTTDRYPQWWDGDDIPTISINNPQDQELFGENPPTYVIFTRIGDKDQIWYTLNDTDRFLWVLNITNWEAPIDYDIWDEYGNGTVTISFWINDTAGNVGFDRVVVKKDIIAPVITINSPSFSDKFNEIPPNISIVIEEPHLDSVWFTLDGGTTNFTFTEITNITTTGIDETINQSVWDLIPDGSITIEIYANDTVGNLRSIVVNISKGEEDDDVISLGNYYIVITVISVISITYGVKRKKKFISIK